MNEIEAANNKKVHEFLKNNPCGSIATHGEDGNINMANVFAYVDNNFFFYIVTRPEHRKSLNIERHPQTTLLFTDQESVIQVECTGVGKAVDEAESVAGLLPNIQNVLIEHKSHYWIPPVSQLDGEGYSVIKIIPESIVFRSYSTKDDGAELEEINVILEGSI